VIIQVLDAANDSNKWRQILKMLPQSMDDIYFSPDWLSLHSWDDDTRPLMFTCEHRGKVWVYPFLLRSITRIGQNDLEHTWHDIESAYGYAGPLSNTSDTKFLHEVQQVFNDWCKAQNVVAEFVRLHPLMQNAQWLDSRVKTMFDRETVSLDFDFFEQNKSPFDAKTRNMISRANKSGVYVQEASDKNSFNQFVSMYKYAMERLNAEQHLYFSDTYFVNLYNLVNTNGCLLLAMHDDKCISAGVFLKGSFWMHYHLAASDHDNMVSGANNQLLLTAARIGYKSGLRGLHLGGGRTSDGEDSLLRFKRSMSTNTHKYFIGKQIHMPDIYEYLCNRWQEHYPSLVSNYGNRLLCYRYAT
tara:strand:- start:335 stop:1405 length:1071 start_codon:yes stop_codon:yes gene_type:complete